MAKGSKASSRKTARGKQDAPSEGAGREPAPESEAVEVEVLDGPPDDDSDEGDDGGPSEDELGQAALADVEVSEEDLDAIETELRRRARAAPTGSTALARRDPMAAYMAEVRQHPLLTRDEEYELAVRWVEDGDTEAARKLVTSNLRLVVKIAHEYRRAYQNLLDLVQEGNVGLVKAVQKFDPYRGVKLSTYSGWWIRAYILKYILNNWRLVKIGTTQNQRKLFFNLRKQREALVAAGVDPTPERIAKELDVSPREVREMERRMAAPDVSLDAPLGSDDGDGTRTRLDLIEDDFADPEDNVDANEFKSLLQDKLMAFGADLSGRELEIFRDRLLSDEPVTLQDLGTRWGVSRERARQLEKRLVLRLREYLQAELGDAVQIALGHEG
ncbi:MAG: RNA polymerase factor sigma-32 [Myxococcales bacterium]|nr:RNA polymerase factor sigma-32 [Myxococcales bacterium]MCB9718418.1 RNA polymerase factor sigma-32 [Myxococcales bacterium]